MILSSIFISLILNIYISKGDDCEYSTPDGIIDLKKLGYPDRPKYPNIPNTDSPTLTLSFNGCFSYSTTGTCQNAAACFTDETSKTTRLIARQAGQRFTYYQGFSTVIYTDGAGTQLNVILFCREHEFSQSTKLSDRDFSINIESKCACPDATDECFDTPSPDKPSNGLSGGAIFIIILISIIVIYLAVSVLILRFFKHEQGVNLIPNRKFWLQIGVDSIHGVRFILSKITKRNTYANV